MRNTSDQTGDGSSAIPNSTIEARPPIDLPKLASMEIGAKARLVPQIAHHDRRELELTAYTQLQRRVIKTNLALKPALELFHDLGLVLTTLRQRLFWW